MFLDNLRDISESILERIKNPFGGTLILVWTIFNWKLVFTIFNLNHLTLDQKIARIQDYLDLTPYWVLLWGPVSFTFVTTITFLTLQHLSLLIYTTFSKWVKPTVFWLVDRNRIADKETVEELRKIASRFHKDFEDTKQELIKNRSENVQLRDRAIELEGKNTSLENQLSDFKSTRFIFIDSFTRDRKAWSKNYWGKKEDRNACRIENGMMILELLPSAIPHEKKESGACIDILGGIFSGETYNISVKVSSDPGTSMKFKLWVHDTIAGQSIETDFETPPNEDKLISVYFEANETNALRVHLHCMAGSGRIYVKDLRISRHK